MSSGKYHVAAPEWDVDFDTEPPPPEAQAYQRISWQADTEDEALALDHIVKAYKRMSTEDRVLLMVLVRRLDILP